MKQLTPVPPYDCATGMLEPIVNRAAAIHRGANYDAGQQNLFPSC